MATPASCANRGISDRRFSPEKSTYLETAYLLLHGELPTASQLKDWTYNVTHHTFIHESIQEISGRLSLRRPPMA